MIYFVQGPDGGAVKIGFTDNIHVRLKHLEAHYRRPLAVLGTIPGGRKEEARVHARFAHLRLGKTEQFRPAAELMSFIGRPLLVGANPDAVEVMGGRGRGMKFVMIKLSPELHRELRIEAAAEDMSVGMLVRRLIEERLAEREDSRCDV